jgi:hypothetical protein
MTRHKYKLGLLVYFRPANRLTDTPTYRPYQIIQRLPGTSTGEPRYRLRSEGKDWIASERELRPVAE